MSVEFNLKMCSSCIFSANSFISESRFKHLKDGWEADCVIQQCHVSNSNGGNVGCRGYYESMKRGEIPNNPVRAIARDAGFPDSVPDDRLSAFYERAGYIRFVEVEEKEMTDQNGSEYREHLVQLKDGSYKHVREFTDDELQRHVAEYVKWLKAVSDANAVDDLTALAYELGRRSQINVKPMTATTTPEDIDRQFAAAKDWFRAADKMFNELSEEGDDV